MRKNKTLQVVFLPHTELHKGNPYWSRLQAGLEQQGAKFVDTPDKLFLQWNWLIQNRGHVDIIHLHFLQHHYALNDTQASVMQLAKFVGKLLLARLLGYRVIWTVHNLLPHERLQPRYVGRLAHVAVAQLSNAIIVHCEYARQALQQEFQRRRNVHTVEHPSYVGVYPNSLSRQQARDLLGLSSQQLVFLFAGAIRPYKGIESLIKSFRKITDDKAVLLIVGKPSEPILIDQLQSLAQDDQRIRIIPQFIADEELQIYFNAADMTVLPYSNVLSSGSALLAMSFGCPVIAPALGCLTEVISSETGILYDPASPDGLFQALQCCQALDLMRMGQNAYWQATELTWAKMAQKTMQAYSTKKVLHNTEMGLRLET